jgi:hypothetical protein
MSHPSIYRARRTAPFVVDRNTVRFLLLPQPLLSTLYLLAVHARMLEASYLPLLIMGVFPIATAFIAAAGLRTDRYSRRRNWAVLEISVVELISAALVFATVALDLSSPSP